MTVAVLALQGAFIEHEKMLESLGEECFEIRQKKDLGRTFEGLVLPGGESTVMGKLLHELDIFATLKQRIEEGLPVLATCAGLILLAKRLENDPVCWFGTLDVTVRRNAFGRQLGSLHTEENYKGLGRIPMTFIRAPVITSVGPKVEILSTVNDEVVAVRQGRQTALAFHPELDCNLSIHESFLKDVRAYRN